MRISTSALVLGAIVAGQASAASIGLGKAHNHAARHVEIMHTHQAGRAAAKRDTSLINAADAASLTGKHGFKGLGINSVKAGNTPWIGADGTWTNEFINQSGEDLVLVVWGPMGSWVNSVVPQITISMPKKSSQTVSFPEGWSGAWAPVYSSTQMKNGQIMDTWGEGTFIAPYSVVDVSREVNMKGRNMSIVGPTCTSDMNTCVFKCQDASVEQCTYGYELVNCATGSQPGANFGTYEGAASGGCGGMGTSANLKTYLG